MHICSHAQKTNLRKALHAQSVSVELRSGTATAYDFLTPLGCKAGFKPRPLNGLFEAIQSDA